MFNTANYEINANQNPSEVAPHTGQLLKARGRIYVLFLV